MSTTHAAASLQAADPQAEYETEQFVKTVIFPLRQPTQRKQERMDSALEKASAVNQEAANRIRSVPPERWGTAQPAKSTWYAWAKTLDHGLSNKTAHENIQRVREAFRSWQSQGYDGDPPSFDKADRCAFYYEQPRYGVSDGHAYVSLPMAAGRGEREQLPIRPTDYHLDKVTRIESGDWNKGRAELMRRDESYYLHQVVRYDLEVLAEPETLVGVDIGLNNLAVAGAVRDGDRIGAELWSGAEMAEARSRFHERKRDAQQDARYEQIREDEQRYVDQACHVISREVVEWAMEQHRPKIVLEDLTDIRETFIAREREHTKDERRALHSWPFQQLQSYIDYKATECGIPVEYVDPRDTSKTCAECGHTADANRETVHFECDSCGYTVNADVNAAFNIASLGPLQQG
jgi:IS605 OrfB family transposase